MRPHSQATRSQASLRKVIYFKLVRNTSSRKFNRGWLPISQYFIWLGPVVAHIAWGESAKLIKEAA